MTRAGASLLVAVAAGTLLVGGCRGGPAAGPAATPSTAQPGARSGSADLDGVEATLDRLERETDTDGERR